jgi:hypothetical protein
VISPTAGRWLVDVSCGVTPKQFIRGEWFLTTAALTGLIWVLTDAATPQHVDRRRSCVRHRLLGPNGRAVLRLGRAACQ